MILVKGKIHNWIVYSTGGEPLSDEAIEQAAANINNLPVKAFILGGYLDKETTFEKLDSLLTTFQDIGMVHGDFGIIIEVDKSLLLLFPEEDMMDDPNPDDNKIETTTQE